MRPEVMFAGCALLACSTDDPTRPEPTAPPTAVGWVAPPATAAEAPLVPAPLRGGAFAIDATGRYFVVGDPDRHRVLIADMEDRTIGRDRAVALGAEPGRIAVQGTRAVVALRQDHVVLIDLPERAEVGRVAVCAAPRGIAWEGDHLHVACAGGELVTLRAADGVEVERIDLEPDLRDVVVLGSRRFVSTFRHADVLVVEGGREVDRWRARPVDADRLPHVAWRLRLTPDGKVALLHQDALTSVLAVEAHPDRPSSPYGSAPEPCPHSPRTSVLSVFEPDGSVAPAAILPRMVLGIDFLPLVDGRFVVVDAGRPAHGLLATVTGERCAGTEAIFNRSDDEPNEELVALAQGPDGTVYAISRNPLEILRLQDGRWRSDLWLDEGRHDPGHHLFHRDAGSGVACASCHPEGTEDGHTWHIEGLGPRRTQDLRGGLRGQEPFHWDHDQRDMQALLDEVFVRRMGGFPVEPTDGERLLDWLDALPLEPTVAGLTPAAERGREIFRRPDVGCADCHAGPRLTNGQAADVGTGKAFAVPSLRGLRTRAPYMHDGCATTLWDRFEPTCGGGDAHGVTSHLDDGEVADLVAYLESL